MLPALFSDTKIESLLPIHKLLAHAVVSLAYCASLCSAPLKYPTKRMDLNLDLLS